MEKEQIKFWKQDYTDEYIKRNSSFNFQLGIEGWNIMRKKIVEPIDQILECGSNISRI